MGDKKKKYCKLKCFLKKFNLCIVIQVKSIEISKILILQKQLLKYNTFLRSISKNIITGCYLNINNGTTFLIYDNNNFEAQKLLINFLSNNPLIFILFPLFQNRLLDYFLIATLKLGLAPVFYILRKQKLVLYKILQNCFNGVL